SRAAMMPLANPAWAEYWPSGPAAKAFIPLAASYCPKALSWASFRGKAGGSKADAGPAAAVSITPAKIIFAFIVGLVLTTIGFAGKSGNTKTVVNFPQLERASWPRIRHSAFQAQVSSSPLACFG